MRKFMDQPEYVYSCENGEFFIEQVDQSIPQSELTDPNFKWEPVVDGDHEILMRRISAREALRIMDFDSSDYDKAKNVCSDNQIYKQAGNSIAVNCIVAILGQLFEGKECVYREVAKSAPNEREKFSQNG